MVESSVALSRMRRSFRIVGLSLTALVLLCLRPSEAIEPQEVIEQMKKNRPGFLIRVLARPYEARLLADILFAESGTLGVRVQEWQRWVLARDAIEVETPHGVIRVKRVRGTDGEISFSAEYDDCKQAALKSGVPLREVVASAEAMARDSST